MTLPVATADTGKLIAAAQRGLGAIYRPGYRYKKAGIMLLELVPATTRAGRIVRCPDTPRSKARMRAVDALNRRFGRDTVTFAASGRRRAWKLRSEFLSPRFTTELGRAAAGLTMCNDFGNRIPYDDYLPPSARRASRCSWPKAAPNLEPRDDIWPTDTAPVIRQTEDGHEFAQLRWGFPPAKPKGAPVINFRSEGRKFPKGRCLVPASHFFEFTGSEIAQDQVEIHQDRRGLVLLRRPVAADAGRAGGRLHAADDRAGPGRRADP